MSDLVNVLNTIRDNASAEYLARVPEATKNNLGTVGNPIISYDAIRNEFLDALVNKIVLQIVDSKIAQNPLALLKKGSMPLGQDAEHIHTNPAKAKPFDKDNVTDLLANTPPDVKSLYYRLNRRDKYPVTISSEMLQTAFTSYNNLQKLINVIVNSLYSGDNYDEFILMKDLVARSVTEGIVKCEQITEPTTDASGKAFVKKLRTISGLFKFPSSNFNMYKSYATSKNYPNPTDAITWTPIESQVLLIKTEILANVDVDVLASAFNMSRADFIGRVIEVDKFDEDGNILCLACDEAFFQVRDNLTKLTTFDNPENLTRKYILHRWQTLSTCAFANAVCLVKTLPSTD